MTGWMAPHMEDHEPLLAQIKAKHAEFDWNDYLTGTKKAATYDGKLCGLPYRITTGIFHYQKALLEQAGFAKPPENWEQFLKTAQAVNTPPDRYAYGLMGMQGRRHVFLLRLLAVLQRRTPHGRFQDRRGVHQRRQGGGGAAVLRRPRSPSTSWCRRRR